MDTQASSDSGLEDRLRDLMMSNSGGPPGSFPGNEAITVPSGAELHTSALDQSPKTPRKRPNQAQRRQMNSQLSIPIDPRPPGPGLPHQNQYPPPGSAGFNMPQMSPHQRPYVSPGPHSADFPRYGGGVHGGQNQWDGRRRSQPNNFADGGPSMPSPHQRQHSHVTSPGHQNQAPRGRGGRQNLFDHRRPQFRPEEVNSQTQYLADLCLQVLTNSEIDRAEIAEKEGFRQRIEAISRKVIAQHEQENRPEIPERFPEQSIELKCFGSLSSGFATKSSDMDLGLLSPLSLIQPEAPGSEIPRLLEKAFLDAGLGARLLARTRVPIIKLCESPPAELRQGLLEEREKWEKYRDSGQPDDDHDHDDEKKTSAEQDDHEEHADDDDHADSSQGDASIPSESYFEVPSAQGSLRLFLYQGAGQTLQAYYDVARRVLRKAGGRDATVGNYKDFDDEAWDILFRVCRAFIQGLLDPNVRERLWDNIGYFPPDHVAASSLVSSRKHTLRGLLAEAEAESVLVAWDSWRFQPYFLTGKKQVDQAIMKWRQYQHNTFFLNDPRRYLKETPEALERLRNTPPLHLVDIVQAKHETPANLCHRISILAKFVGVSMQRQTAEELLGSIVDEYINAVRPYETRDALRQAVALLPGPPSITDVSFLHRRLYLARELTLALEKDSYEESVAQDIRTYLSILEAPVEFSPRADGGYLIGIHIPSEQSDLIGKIRGLPDPLGLTARTQPRDRYRDKLEFPKSGIGVQCDINFSAHLGLQNTLLLRCYSHTDPRVRPMVLFIKHWAKMRGINSGYRGTLSSYGYVLMVLHYLVNVARPFVCPNLQQLAPPVSPQASPAEIQSTVQCKGYNIQFWRNEQEIIQLASAGQLTHNTDSVASLLRGFFEYYSHGGAHSSGYGRCFDWGRDVLSLRTQGGLITKQSKGWTGAKTTLEKQEVPQSMPQVAATQGPGHEVAAKRSDDLPLSPSKPSTEAKVKEVRHRYLFAIEDPFELEHNVARTVTHNGIVSIRDEFRRAWNLIQTAGHKTPDQELLQDTNVVKETKGLVAQLLDDLHGVEAWGVAS